MEVHVVLFDAIVLLGQAVIPVGIALIHLVLCLFVLFRRRRSNDALTRLFIAHLLLTAVWNVNLAVAVVGTVPAPLPALTWMQIALFGLIALGVLYWTFARAFLQQPRTAPWGWGIGLVGLTLAISLDMRWISLPAEALDQYPWITGWLNADNAGFVSSVAWWGLLMGLTLLTAEIQQIRTQSPAHKNRIQYLLIATLLLSAGYGMALSLPEPFRTTGLVVTWLGNALNMYTVVEEDLLDLSTGVRRTTSTFVVALVTFAFYLAAIYLIQIFLSAFLASTFASPSLDPEWLVAAVTAVLLTIVYMPIRRVSQGLTSHVLFGRRYDYQAVIRDYSQAISNILYLDELASTALLHIKRTLNVDEGVLWILDSESAEQLHFRTVPSPVTDRFPESVPLTKDTPLIHRLADEGQPLAQYTIDISPQFKRVPEQERSALKRLNLEWFIPILKKERLIGMFGLGPKASKRRYTVQDMRLLTTLADQTALALENAALVDRLQRNLEETTRMRNLMDNVFDSMDDGVVTTDTVGRITLFNQAAESILAMPPDNCIGVPYLNALPSLANTVVPHLVANVLGREDHYADYEIVSVLPGRGRVNLNMNLAPLKDAQDQTQGVTMVVDDLTETKRLQAVQDMFRRYVSPAVVDRLPADPSELRLGGHRQEVTILFADIRGFTRISEMLESEKLVDMLNEYLSMAASSILMYEGTLDKFMGDAVMGIFNAPLEQEDHVLRAVRAAVAMQRTIADYHRNAGPEQRLSFGVGLHTGEVVVGNVGMSARMDYTAIGDTVNLAKRIQENTPGGKVLISQAVYDVVRASVKATLYKEMKVKGREQSVVTYELQLA
jgi:adenylate cyclase